MACVITESYPVTVPYERVLRLVAVAVAPRAYGEFRREVEPADTLKAVGHVSVLQLFFGLVAHVSQRAASALTVNRAAGIRAVWRRLGYIHNPSDKPVRGLFYYFNLNRFSAAGERYKYHRAAFRSADTVTLGRYRSDFYCVNLVFLFHSGVPCGKILL